jgi:hypothetical protein
MEEKKKITGFRERYYEGFSRRIVLDGRGKAGVEYVYEGTYYILAGSDRERTVHKVIPLISVALSSLTMIGAMCIAAEANSVKAVTAMQAAALLLLLALWTGVFTRLTAKRDKTLWEYRMAVKTVSECSLLFSVLQTVVFVTAMVIAVTGKDGFNTESLLFLFLTFLSSSLLFLLFLFVRREHYLTRQSNDLPHGEDITGDFARNY